MSWIRFEEIRPEINARIFALNAEQLWWGDYNPEQPNGSIPFVPIFWIDRPPFTEEEIAFSAIKPVESEEITIEAEDGCQDKKDRKDQQKRGKRVKVPRKNG